MKRYHGSITAFGDALDKCGKGQTVDNIAHDVQEGY